MEKVKYSLEFIIQTSVGVLYSVISTPSGMAEWFADDVDIKGDVYTFKWDGSEESARLLNKKRDEFSRFRWIVDEEENSTNYFEFRIKVDGITNDVALIITDYAFPDEQEDAEALWTSQVENLKHVIGS
jgi:uncharacterized protein YndB with AHSA1/START domain